MMVKIANVSVLLVAVVGFAGIVFAESKEVRAPEQRAMSPATMAPASARHSRRVRAIESGSAKGVYGEPVLLDAQDYVDEQERTNAPMEPRAPEDTIK